MRGQIYIILMSYVSKLRLNESRLLDTVFSHAYETIRMENVNLICNCRSPRLR